MDEDVLAAAALRGEDEAVTLLAVEPLNGADSHAFLSDQSSDLVSCEIVSTRDQYI